MDNIKKNKLEKYDGQGSVASEKVRRNYNVNPEIMLAASAYIDVYRQNYLDNSHSLIQFTGLTERQYSNRLKSLGCRSFRSIKYAIQKQENLGFDMIHFAGMCMIFKIPFDMCKNLNFKIKKVDFTKFGLTKDCYSSTRHRHKKVDVQYSHLEQLTEKDIKKYKAMKKLADSPKKHINFLAQMSSHEHI